MHSVATHSADASHLPVLSLKAFFDRLGVSVKSPGDAFSRLDKDADGFATLAELKSAAGFFTPPLAEGEAESVLHGFDANRDGAVVVAEVIGAVRLGRFIGEPAAPHDPTNLGAKLKVWKASKEPLTLWVFNKRMGDFAEQPAEAFARLDSNSDGWVSFPGFLIAVGTFAWPLTREEADYAFRGFDLNGDRFISAQEWKAVHEIGKFYPTPAKLEENGIKITEPPGKPQVPPEPPASTDTQGDDTEAQNAALEGAMPTPKPSYNWEVGAAPINISEFKKHLHDGLPSAWSALASSQGENCIDLNAFRKGAAELNPPLTEDEADYSFCGMDHDHDKRVCHFEFHSTLKVGAFFPTRNAVAQLKEVGALNENGTSEQAHGDSHNASQTARPSGDDAIPKRESSYTGVPAIVNGHLELSISQANASQAPGDERLRQFAKVFASALDQELSMRVQVANIKTHDVNRTSGRRVIELLWTAGWTPDGGALQAQLQKRAPRIERIVEEGIHRESQGWVQRVAVWVKATFTYYGPHAHSLQHGPKISQNLGHRPGQASETGSPAYVD